MGQLMSHFVSCRSVLLSLFMDCPTSLLLHVLKMHFLQRREYLNPCSYIPVDLTSFISKSLDQSITKRFSLKMAMVPKEQFTHGLIEGLAAVNTAVSVHINMTPPETELEDSNREQIIQLSVIIDIKTYSVVTQKKR